LRILSHNFHLIGGTHLHQDTSNQGPVEVAEVKVAMVTEGEARGGGAVQQATAVQYLASHSNDDLLESALCHRKNVARRRGKFHHDSEFDTFRHREFVRLPKNCLQACYQILLHKPSNPLLICIQE
jgi:hypothetical protein